MDLASALGLCGTFVGLVRALPQLIGLLRSRGASGVSLDTAATSAIVSFGWAVYGLWTHQPFVALATGASGFVFLLVTIFALRFGRKVSELKIAPVWLCVLVGAGLVWTYRGLGLVLPVSILVSNIPQVRVAWKEASLEDLSLGTWLLSMSDGLVWGVYSIIQQDRSIMVFAVFQLITSLAIVLLKCLRSHSSCPVDTGQK